jgi:hypothetical protein
MDLSDIEDLLDEHHSDHGDTDIALWGASDLLGSSDHVTNPLLSGEDDGALGPTDLLFPSEWNEPMLRPSTLYQAHIASELATEQFFISRAQMRADADSWSFLLEDTFLAGGSSLQPSSSLPWEGFCLPDDGDAQLWLDSVPTVRCIIGDLILWVRGACLSVLPDDSLGNFIHLAWNFFCATLAFSRTCAAFKIATAPVPPLPLGRSRVLLGSYL